MPNSTGKNGNKKAKAIMRPKKPRKDFPLYAHPAGYWAKKIRGKLHYFGRWGQVRQGVMERLPGDGWEKAEALYEEQRAALYAGRVPLKFDASGQTIRDLCNKFLRHKMLRLESGEIGVRTFAEYRATTDRLAKVFGRDKLTDELTDEDFDELRANIARVYGPVRLGNEIVRVRSVFKHGKKQDIVPDTFKKPSKRIMRKHRNESDKKLFTATEIRELLDGRSGKKKLAGSSPQLRAMILLGINCGFGNADVADLPRSALNLDAGWVNFPREKTGIDRRCPLWPETVDAIRVAIKQRPKPKNKEADGGCVFLTVQGRRWVRVAVKTATTGDGHEFPDKTVHINSVGQEFGKVLRRLKINGRKGLGFYSLRHTFRTVADAAKDNPAARLIMGHTDGSIDDVYREEIDDDRLLAVTDHVHCWLFAEGGAK